MIKKLDEEYYLLEWFFEGTWKKYMEDSDLKKTKREKDFVSKKGYKTKLYKIVKNEV